MRDPQKVTEARQTWNARMAAEGMCLSCGQKEATQGTRCDDCADKNRQSSLDEHHRTYVPRSAVGVDGKRHYRCRVCNLLGHQAKTCNNLPAVTVEYEVLPPLRPKRKKEPGTTVTRCRCLCGERLFGELDPQTVERFRLEHAGHTRKRKEIVNEQFELIPGRAA